MNYQGASEFAFKPSEQLAALIEGRRACLGMAKDLLDQALPGERAAYYGLGPLGASIAHAAGYVATNEPKREQPSAGETVRPEVDVARGNVAAAYSAAPEE